jgi:hypothetical protein
MADDEPKPAAEEGLDQRVSSLETGQQTMTEKLDKILGIVGAGGHDAEGSTDPKEAGAPNIAREIRQQLDERDAAAKKKAEEDGLHSTVGELQTKLAELAEKPPTPMPRRIERLMGWT